MSKRHQMGKCADTVKPHGPENNHDNDNIFNKKEHHRFLSLSITISQVDKNQ